MTSNGVAPESLWDLVPATGDEPDVDALMARIREKVAEQRAATVDGTTAAPATIGLVELAAALQAQASFNQTVSQALAQVVQQLQDGDRAALRLEATLAEQVEAVGRVSQTLAEQLTALPPLASRVEACERAIDELRAQLTSLRRESVPPYGLGAERAFDYVAFEHRFRGAPESIRARQRRYVDLFHGRQHVLDLGCGRGEFLELLAEAGVPAQGVESRAEMVAVCQTRGLNVVQADLFKHLRAQPEDSLDGIFVSQVVEHLTPGLVQELVALCGARLAPGGLLVAETVNPLCPTALGNFYLDPTHVRPVPPGLLSFLVEQAGLEMRCLQFSSPAGTDEAVPPLLETTGPLPAAACHYQDYALIAARPAGGTER